MKVSKKALVELINDNVDFVRAEVREVYRDYGLGTKWKTVVVQKLKDGQEYQLLSVREHEKIEQGLFDENDAELIIEEIKERGW